MWGEPLTGTSAKRGARVKLTLTEHTIEALEPAGKSWLAWDDELTGFGVRVQPTGVKSYFVNYRAGDGGRKAPNKRVVIGRHGKVIARAGTSPGAPNAGRSRARRRSGGWA